MFLLCIIGILTGEEMIKKDYVKLGSEFSLLGCLVGFLGCNLIIALPAFLIHHNIHDDRRALGPCFATVTPRSSNESYANPSNYSGYSVILKEVEKETVKVDSTKIQTMTINGKEYILK